MQLRRSASALVLMSTVLSAAAALPATASAITANVTGDNGAPISLEAPVSIRTTDFEVVPALAPGEARYSMSVTGPAGNDVGSTSCASAAYAYAPFVTYVGGGVYSVVLRTFGADDLSCSTPLSERALSFTVAPLTTLAPLPARYTMRAADTSVTTPLPVQVGPNPGADLVELFYARNATVGPDGGLVGTPNHASVDATGAGKIDFPEPGTYTVVARSGEFTMGTTIYDAFTAPQKVIVKAPFDILTMNFTDATGPRYKIRGVIREDASRGKVTIGLRKGSKGHFRKIGTPKIRKDGSFVLGFRQDRLGTYSIRVTFKGSASTLKGTYTDKVRFTRRFAG